MAIQNSISAPVPTLRRLPRYIHVLKRLKKGNIKFVSATTIAKELGIESIQVRKDLSVTGVTGKPKVGFELDKVIVSIKRFLHWDNRYNAFLIGFGALGEAILGYDDFKNCGLNIIAAFDVDKKKIGKNFNGVEIFSMNDIYSLAEKMEVSIAVITTPGNVAQQIANDLVKAGIKAIWNFSPVPLKVEENIIVESVHLSQSLAVLTHKLSK